jgi:PTS system cellobiose-specific IIB component
MKNITLFCAAGMSTSLLITKMERAAREKNIEVSLNAFPQAEMERHLDNVDAVLLGPQIRYVLPKAERLCGKKGIPVDVISPADYGMMDGEKVLEQALELIDKNKK